MQEYLKGPSTHLPPQRHNKTSLEPRRNLKSQAGNRLMGLTGGLRRSQEEKEPIEEES